MLSVSSYVLLFQSASVPYLMLESAFWMLLGVMLGWTATRLQNWWRLRGVRARAEKHIETLVARFQGTQQQREEALNRYAQSGDPSMVLMSQGTLEAVGTQLVVLTILLDIEGVKEMPFPENH